MLTRTKKVIESKLASNYEPIINYHATRQYTVSFRAKIKWKIDFFESGALETLDKNPSL